MRIGFGCRFIAFLLMLATLMTALPLVAFAQVGPSAAKEEVYLKSVKLEEGSKEDAKAALVADGYIFFDQNLNEGTGQNGVWLGYQTTTDPTQAIYDMKLMNMKGGFTLTSMKEALATQESAFAAMTADLNYLVEEFVEAYKEGSVPAQKAYKALNFFRVVNGETELAEENGLGYQIVNGGVTQSMLTEIIMFCNPDLVDSIVKILTMGIQIRNENWMQQLSELGPYDADTFYMEDETELRRRAEQLLNVLSLYAGAYNAMEKSGIIPDKLNENFESEYEGEKPTQLVSAQEADLKKLDESRYKFYKVAFDELDKYQYGKSGGTLKDFFCSLDEEGSEKKLYPLVSVLTDGEFAALSYGCFLELANGVGVTSSSFDSYDELYAALTEEASSVYLYAGVDEILFQEEVIVGFTETAQRHMASTGELEFFDKESSHEEILDAGIRVAKCIAASGMAIMGVTKITMGVITLISVVSTTVSESIASGVLAGVMKFCSIISGGYALLIVLAAFALAVAVSYIAAVIDEYINGKIDWDDNPMPKYLYDVKEVTFSQNSDDGITTEFMKRPVFALYEAVTDTDGEVVDLNAHSKEATQWIGLFVSYDRQGDNAKPIKAEDLLVQKGSGVTPDGYVPLTRFGEVVAYDLNQWDEDDDVNGIYLFYKQDMEVAAESGTTYYISEVYLQSGESDAHCISLLQAAGYTPINMNLSPDWDDGDFAFNDKVYAYLGYKVTTNEKNAIRDMRVDYGPTRGEIRYGAATYAECGSNGAITLYATKYDEAGTPLLAGGIVCTNSRDRPALGYEPVNLFGGGPAVSFNVSRDGIGFETEETFVYFLPETTFTSGKLYLGGVSFITLGLMGSDMSKYNPNRLKLARERLKAKDNSYNAEDDTKIISDYLLMEIGYDATMDSAVSSDKKSELRDNVVLHGTFNPYRAIYELKATAIEDSPNVFSFEGVGYSAWNRIEFTLNTPPYQEYHDFFLSYNSQSELDSLDMIGKLYLAGNPVSDNLYDTTKGKMMMPKTKSDTKVEGPQPIELANVKCIQNNNGLNVVTASNSTFTPVTDVFGGLQDAAIIKEYWIENEYKFYAIMDVEAKPYVSAITAIDELTLYRAYGGYDAGLSYDHITNDMLLAQLASQGATNFNAHRVSLKQTDVWDNTRFDSYDEINAIRFGYTRTAEKKNALTDVFLYFNGFSTDEPPKELYRGTVKYTLLCEIPFNMTGYKNAPKPGVYLYGTTSTKAGNKIIDFEVSGTPFMNGYETVRTMNGRSLVAEILEYSKKNESHPMKKAAVLFATIFEYFQNEDEKQKYDYFYLHIKREEDDLNKQKPYIGKLYVDYYVEDKAAMLDRMFDQGAEGYIDVDLNKGAGGEYVYLGYSYTADSAKAIKEIRAAHDMGSPATLTDDQGRKFELVSDIDLNMEAGGDYIYLYTTTESQTAKPITSLQVAFEVSTGARTLHWHDNTTPIEVKNCTKHWNSNKNSDLNRGAGGEYIYLMYTTVDSDFKGTDKVPNYGKDKTYTRKEIEDLTATGKYIGGLYVMDKETIRLEKIENGTLTTASNCNDIKDQEVFDRLKAMGATTIMQTPIMVNSGGYFEGNTNKVFIGYSRTDDTKKAIRNIAIKVKILSMAEPKQTIEANNKKFNLVAEAADGVTALPKAINLIGIQGGGELLLPRFYLYYSTSSGSDPICDITIDDIPILNGWNTVRSANLTDPFADVYDQAYAQYELAEKDDSDFYDSEIMYSDQLYKWMEDICALYDPEDAKAKPFYIHVKRYTEDSLEEIKPYIGEVFAAKGDSRHEALSKLVAFEPDGFVDVDLNQDAGGNWVYIAYKRVAKSRDALTDIMVYQGKKFEPTRRLIIDGKTVKFTLVSDVDLNAEAGGKYLYLYTADSKYTGNPITGLDIKLQVDSYLKCGVERVTVKLADRNVFTDEYIDLNKDAGGDSIYMIMARETTEGHTSNGIEIEKINVPATCDEDGYYGILTNCKDCAIQMEVVQGVHKASGKHPDADGDGDHKCDDCGKRDVTDHVYGDPVEKNRIEATAEKDGSYQLVLICKECEEEKVLDKIVIPAGTPTKKNEIASLVGNGLWIHIVVYAGIALLAGVVVYIEKKKKIITEKGIMTNEESE